MLAEAAAAPRPESEPLPPVKTRSLLVHVGREAMACEFEVVLNAGQHKQGTDVAVAALDLVDQLEAQLTVYRDDSEVSRLNQLAASEPVPVESRLFELLVQAKVLAEQTGGAFDITSGPLTKVWGFYRRQGKMPSAHDVAAALAKVGSRSLELDEARQTVRFGQPGMEINLGAIGKGYALDRAAGLLLTEGVSDFMIHGGNSSVLASGSRQLDVNAGSPAAETALADEQTQEQNRQPTVQVAQQDEAAAGWTVALRHPLRPDQRLAEFKLFDQALGTSGSGTQYFHHQGKRYGHILDPRTGWPADRVLSSTVIAPTAAEADALSTALYVLGLDAAREFGAKRPDISALLTTQSSRAGVIELHPLNLPDDRWRQIPS